MSSILTNTSAMVALQTLKSINTSLNKTQDEISTGKTVASAKDNSAIWAISKVMESDVAGFKAISDSLALGESTVAVGRQASETVTDLLTDIKGKIVASQEENVDRSKIQTDINALKDQIKSVVGAAQFNGLNLVAGSDDVDILSSLDRDTSGGISASHITVARQDLTTTAGTFGSTSETAASFGTINGATASDYTSDAGGKVAVLQFDATSIAANDTFQVNIGGASLNYTAVGTETATDLANFFIGQINALGLEGVSAATGTNAGELDLSNTNAFDTVGISVAASSGTADIDVETLNGTATGGATSGTIEQRAATIDFSTTAGVEEGLSFKVTVASQSFNYIAGKGETMEDVVKGLKTAIDSNLPDGITTSAQYDSTAGQWKLAVDDSNGDGTSTTFSLQVASGGTASGGLFGLDNIDVTTDKGAAAALDNIETMIQTAIDSSAAFGSVQGRIETQSNFVSKLTDAMKSGIGKMVDADMEEASAKLQALQVQQQLGVQSLSIANQGATVDPVAVPVIPAGVRGTYRAPFHLA